MEKSVTENNMESYCFNCDSYTDHYANDESGNPICLECYLESVDERKSHRKSVEDLEEEKEAKQRLDQQYAHTKSLGLKQLKDWGVKKWNSFREKHPEKYPDMACEDFRKMDLSFANLSNANLKNANFYKSTLISTDLSEADLDSADLYKAKLNGANLYRAKIREATLINANLVGANLNEADISQSNLRAAILLKTNMISTNFSNSELTAAQIIGAKLVKTVFENSELMGADLSYSECRSVNFSNSNFTGVTLERVVLMDSIFNDVKAEHVYIDREHKKKVEFNDNMQFEEFIKSFDFFGHTRQYELPCVFLSYSRIDSPQVFAVDAWLKEKGFKVILDERDFFSGENIRNEILRCIQQAEIIVCFISKNSKSRPYPKLEREIADNLRLEGKASVIYFKLDNTKTDIEHEHRLYIPGHQLTFLEACDKLYQGIIKYATPSKPFNTKLYIEAGKNWTKILPSKK